MYLEEDVTLKGGSILSNLYQKLYTTLFNHVEDVITYINSEMVIKETYDWDHIRKVMLKLQAALQECEDIYVDEE